MNVCFNKKKELGVKGIIAILPAFNEEISIGSMVLHARDHAERVIVVDDGSSDRTAEIAGFAGAEVIRHTKNMGKGVALKTGFDLAGRNGAKVIVTMDTDGQHDPEEIPKLVAPILQGEADIVNGSRYMNGKDRNTPFYRRVGQNVLDKATNFNSGLQLTDTQSGFRAF
ncbi:MAG: glycosyltransferase family 2 protein, partial [Candidatus Methanoperedens sp.]